MNVREPAYDERYPPAAARQVSPLPAHRHAAPVRTVAVKRFHHERSLSPLSADPPSREAEPARKKAKSYEAIKKEVRDILEKNLIGNADHEVQVEALHALRAPFKTVGASPQERQRKKAYRRAISEWNGCHFVLVVLRRELDKDGSDTVPNRDVVFYALAFLRRWNDRGPDRRDALSRHHGLEAVARAMRGFRNDAGIQYTAVACLHYFARDDNNDMTRRRELVEGGAIPLIFRALMSPNHNVKTPSRATILLGRLCDVAEVRHFDGLVEAGALEALARVAKVHKTSAAAPDSEKILSACQKLMTKLLL
jgi:hypothetical protein